MQVSVTFRNMEPKEILREYVQEKMAKLKKFLDHPLEANVVLAVEKHRHMVEVTLAANRTTVNAQEETEDMFSAIDLVVDKLERQIRKTKDKIKRGKAASARVELGEPMDIDGAGNVEEGVEPKIIKSKKVVAKPMSAEEAALQMEVIKNDFLIFTNADSKILNVIYRRKDGHYGLIEPQID